MKAFRRIGKIFLVLGVLAVGFMNCSGKMDANKRLLSSFSMDPVVEPPAPQLPVPAPVLEPEQEPEPQTEAQPEKPEAAPSSLLSLLVHGTLRSPDWQKEMVLQKEWAKVREVYREKVKNTKNNAADLYNVQMELSAFVQFAYEHNKTQWMIELMDIYLEAVDTAVTTSRLLFYYPTPTTYSQMMSLKRPMKLWPYADGSENVITSSQFLYPVTLMLLWVAQKDMYGQSAIAKKFFDNYFNIALRDHYLRWVFNKDAPVGEFQVQGWGCNEGTFSHKEHLENLLYRRYGTKYFSSAPDSGAPSYCNAFLDMDLYIIAGVAHLLSVYQLKKSSAEMTMTAKEFKDLSEYLKLGFDVFKSRTVFKTAKNFSGSSVETADFENGSFDDHPDFQYTGDTDPTFPGWSVAGQAPNRPAKPAKGVSWDISHARRLPRFTSALRRTHSYLQLINLDELKRIESGFANQIAYQVFQGNLSDPTFNNFFDGTNGWYRVNYSGRAGFGYGPSSWDLGSSVLNGGYGFWDEYNHDLGEILIHSFSKVNYGSSYAPYACLQVLSALPSRYFPKLLGGPRTEDGSVCR